MTNSLSLPSPSIKWCTDNKGREGEVNPVMLISIWEGSTSKPLTPSLSHNQQPPPNTIKTRNSKQSHSVSSLCSKYKNTLFQTNVSKLLTRAAFRAAHMMRLQSAVQVLHLTRTSSSASANTSLTSIVFHSLADDTSNSWTHAETHKDTVRGRACQDRMSSVSTVNSNHLNTNLKNQFILLF